MWLVPARPLLIAAWAPVLLALTYLVEPSLLGAMVAVDGLLLGVAAIDALGVARPEIDVRRAVADTASLGRPVKVELEVHNTGRRRLDVQVQDALPIETEGDGLPQRLRVEPKRVARATYRVRPLERGPQTLGDHHVRYPSPLGLWTRQVRVPAEDRIQVYPDVQAVRHYELLARTHKDLFASRALRMRGGDTEFERLRDYQPDDEFRRIEWKATARRQRLTVRSYQLEMNQNVFFMVDCGRFMTSVWDDLTSLDHALNATLMLSHVAVRRGDLVGLLAFSDAVHRFLPPSAGVWASNRIIQATYDLFPSMVESNYEAAFRTLRSQVRKRSLVVLITHALDERNAMLIRRLTRECMPRHLPLVALLKDRDLEEAVHRDTPDAVYEAAAAAEVLLWRQRLVAELQRSGVLVLDVFHRQLTGSLVARYLETKAQGLI